MTRMQSSNVLLPSGVLRQNVDSVRRSLSPEKTGERQSASVYFPPTRRPKTRNYVLRGSEVSANGSKILTSLRASNKPATPRASSNEPATPRASSNKPATPRASSNKPATPRASSNKPATPRASSNKPATLRALNSKPSTPRASKKPQSPRASLKGKLSATLAQPRESKAPRLSDTPISPRKSKKPSPAGSPKLRETSPPTPTRHPSRRLPQKRALVIGINYFGQGRRELCGCEHDASAMKDLLRSTGWTSDDIRVLTDKNDPKSQPTRRNIIYACKWLVRDAQPGDVLFFSYSGHGSQKLDRKGYEDDGLNETLVPVDVSTAGMITDDELNGIMVRPLPSGCKLFSVIDACHSGTALDLPYRWQDARWKEDINPYHTKGDVQLISGCKDRETSADDDDGGAMTKAFVAVLKKITPGMTYIDVMGELHKELRSRAFLQRPMLTSSQPFDPSRKFVIDDIIPNQNERLGRTFRRSIAPKKPKRKFGLLEFAVFILLAVVLPVVFIFVGVGWIGWAALGGVFLLYVILVLTFRDMFEVRMYFRMVGLRIMDIFTCCSRKHAPARKSMGSRLSGDLATHVCE